MLLGFFNYEVNKARRHLEEIFQADTSNHWPDKWKSQ
jgi:hypothetical protein